MPVTLDARTRALFDGRNFPVISTVNADGSPQSSVVWVKRDGDALLFVAPAAGLRARNLRRDPRISVSVFDASNPYESAEVRGVAHLLDDGVQELSDDLARAYLGETHAPPDDKARLVVRVVPEKVIAFPRT
ncbi:PPOX class F420-dependent oxidoreductase [Streptomyces sp. NBC_00059]|uniref:PPOX class F420-dependent oxidoreductase n=1 Tax=Streptomyces sp. NBC_00059 TaxID=2975635 RepID=UPI0022510998|nr:PPOX class F420-dependent oxidoreductase [Streptomyces sp. NBC_00059]MCX5415231.1 PPOX class F420-dependent oxidoreductase [Streptomyces sp. NBC_00059]